MSDAQGACGEPYTTLTLERDGAVAMITLDRPDAANSLDMAMSRELMRIAIVCDEDPDIRAVVLTGRGRFFCAGGDLNAFAGYGECIGPAAKEITACLHAAVSRLTRMPKPLVVAVNGPAAGAGFSLAVTGDIVLASESAHFTLAYTAAGLSPDGGATWTLPRLVGLQRARALMLENRRLSASEAHDWGLVTRVVADDALAAQARETAHTLAAGPTGAFAKVKTLLAGTFENGLEAQMEAEARAITERLKSTDGQEGIQAFLARRTPDFSGE